MCATEQGILALEYNPILSIDPQFLGAIFLINGLRSDISMGAVMGLIIGASVMTVLQAARIVGEALGRKP